MLKKTFVWALSLIFILNASTAIAENSQSSLIGTWQLVDGWVITDDGEIQYDLQAITSRKILNRNDFAFVSRKNGQFWAASTGQYRVEGNQYSEIPQLLSYPIEDGTIYVFTFRLQGDDWFTERYANGKLVEREHWRRLR
ncbi:hypothetical protein KO507_10875 [Gilvimarinus agarilyticus]|uniref:hypothetical protein n=1 Tax=unclassified Gilvimarinus TaxID=2642066 RepID=UPI001C0A3AF3|nr:MULTISPECIES: hypothetical protein [unclassified Gilvimarinus]MBU2886266.1 hypothetical protein [Gilvimarinus agarilyticus]MDO6570954.1 hypothetical protein [Gilvimarinus sp. 2_MG-2023]MDO6747759.1 hypothetical protein [Gilvimarinus sp. 1_MG-2023]